MATFKVGDSVRIIGALHVPRAWKPAPPIGRRGVIVAVNARPEFFPWIVLYEGQDCSGGDNEFGCNRAAFQSHELEPAVDPKADAFIEQVKKWKPEPDMDKPATKEQRDLTDRLLRNLEQSK